MQWKRSVYDLTVKLHIFHPKGSHSAALLMFHAFGRSMNIQIIKRRIYQNEVNTICKEAELTVFEENLFRRYLLPIKCRLTLLLRIIKTVTRAALVIRDI